MPKGVYERCHPVAGCPLSRRELEVVGLLAEGLTMKQVALRLGIAHSTVRCQLNTAYRRLGLAARAQLVIRCEREGWIASDPAGRSRVEVLLEEVKPILENCQRQLEQGTRHRVTRSQYAYLKAFDQFLRSPGRSTDQAMVDALAAVLQDAQVVPSGRNTRRHGYKPRVAA